MRPDKTVEAPPFESGWGGPWQGDRSQPKNRRARFSRLSAFFASAMVWLCGSALLGAGMIVLGIFVLAGLGWGIIASGVALLLIAGLLQMGIARG